MSETSELLRVIPVKEPLDVDGVPEMIVSSVELWSNRVDVLFAWKEQGPVSGDIREGSRRFKDATASTFYSFALTDDLGNAYERGGGAGSGLEGWILSRTSFTPAASSEARFLRLSHGEHGHELKILL